MVKALRNEDKKKFGEDRRNNMIKDYYSHNKKMFFF